MTEGYVSITYSTTSSEAKTSKPPIVISLLTPSKVYERFTSVWPVVKTISVKFEVISSWRGSFE